MARRRYSKDRMTTVAIPEQMYDFLVSKKEPKEPLYLTLYKIINGYYDSEAGKQDEELRVMRENIRKYQKRVVELENKLQQQLIV
jgi:hypothetical protein